MNTIAIDLGASFVKGAVINDGQILYSKRVKAPKVHGDEPLTEPIQILSLKDTVQKLFDELLLQNKEQEYCVSMSNEMHGFLLVDEQNNPATDYISWQKEYGKITIDELSLSGRDTFEKNEFAEDVMHSGIMPRGGLPTCNLWYLSHTKDIVEELKGRTLVFKTLGDYMLNAITGLNIKTHPTNAAATGFYDIKNGCWNKKLISEATGGGVLNILFPEVGEAAERKDGVIVKPAIGDHQAALLGAKIHNNSQLSFNLGTGAQVAKVVSEPEFSNEWQIQPYFDGKFIKRIPYLPSGRALNVLFRLFKSTFDTMGIEIEDEAIWDRFREIASKPKDVLSHPLRIDLSFFENMASKAESGSIKGIFEDNLTFENLIAEVFNQMSENFNTAAEKISDTKIKEIIFTGGIADKFPVIRENILNHFDNPENKSITEETFLGLYYYSVDRFVF